MQLNAYLHFNGTCEEALKFYEKTLGGKIDTISYFGGTPAAEQVPPDWKQKVLHARLNVQGQIVMASDAPPGRYTRPQGFSMSLMFKDVAEGERIFKALSERGFTIMPFATTFWSKGFGMCVDPYGIPWMVNCD
jgi:PhnB protein